MNTYEHSVSLDESRCTGCTTCIKRCPTEAIRVDGGHAVINSDRCIDCGECIRVCQHHAKIATCNKLDHLYDYKWRIALPAPSLYGQFEGLEDVDYVLQGLLDMGFNDVYEVSQAAEIVSQYTELRNMLLNFTSMIELELDFSEEDVEFADRKELCRLANHMEAFISRLVNSFNVGNAIKNGIPVIIIGETNAGKSTLLNMLVNEERAIVSEIHGTTRDVIEDTVNIQGITFRFIDTAGIRETTDRIETLGIERTFQKLDQASIVLWVIDSTTARFQYRTLFEKIMPHCVGKKLIQLFNKTDLITSEQRKLLSDLAGNADHLHISAKQEEKIPQLEDLLVQSAALPQINQNEVIVTNVRHYEALVHVLESIHRVQFGLETGLSGDLLSQDIRECIFYLSSIVGEVTTEEVLANIFKNFCIGK